jgi:hypothetical protein
MPETKPRKGRVELKPETETKNYDNQPTDMMTPDQLSIHRRVLAESEEWEPITEESMLDYSLAVHPLSLKDHFPEAWKESVEKRYAFRFCERSDKRIDELTRSGHPVTRWKLCTRTTTPFLPKYVDPIWGCITRLDQVMLFRPYDRHMMEKRAKDGFAQAKAESGRPENYALRRAQDGIEAYSGEKYRISSGDEVQYEDARQELGELVVED